MARKDIWRRVTSGQTKESQVARPGLNEIALWDVSTARLGLQQG